MLDPSLDLTITTRFFVGGGKEKNFGSCCKGTKKTVKVKLTLKV
jgi:hypothetical protein